MIVEHHGVMLQGPPVHVHVGAPLQASTQLPPVQLVIVHEVALWHVR